MNNAWGTVCDEGWDDQDAAVVCRQLGFPPNLASHSSLRSGSGPVFWSSVNCTGEEEELLDCELDVPSDYYSCLLHESDAGVVCRVEDVEGK